MNIRAIVSGIVALASLVVASFLSYHDKPWWGLPLIIAFISVISIMESDK